MRKFNITQDTRIIENKQLIINSLKINQFDYFITLKCNHESQH